MKRTFKSFFVSALLVLVCFTLVACVNQKVDTDINQAVFGNKYPEKIAPAHKINSAMSGLEMYEAGVQNFYDASFTAARQLGDITTNSSLLGKMYQKLDCFRIKQDNIYYLDSNTYTTKGMPNIKMCDHSIYKDGVYKVRSAESKNIDVKDGQLIVKKWPEVEVYSSLQSGLNIYPDDLTRINMFIVNEDTIKFQSKPVHDAKNKTYKFIFNMDVSTDAIKDYMPVMEYKTKKGGVPGEPDITFNRLKLTIEMWDNGLIKCISNEESYTVMALGTKNTTTLLSKTYFTYDRTEVNINEYLVF